MKVYVLLEQVCTIDQTPYSELIGVYKNKKDAQTQLEKTIQTNINEWDFVLDEENEYKPEVFKNHTILFYEFQENWDNYIEYKIIEKEVLFYE